MKYRVQREGVLLGSYTLEELRHRRESGELTGREYVQLEGRKDWQPLDLFLQYGDQLFQSSTKATRSSSSNLTLVWIAVTIAGLVFLAISGLVVAGVVRAYNVARARSPRVTYNPPVRSEAMTAASTPVEWTTNTLTVKDVRRVAGEFDKRQWVVEYQLHGRHENPNDKLTRELLDAWIERYYGAATKTNSTTVERLSATLGKLPNNDDPLALTVAGLGTIESYTKQDCLARAVKGFAHTNSYHAYPAFVAAVQYGRTFGNTYASQKKFADQQALLQLEKAFADGSILPADQTVIAQILIDEWGRDFFQTNAPAITGIVHRAGTNYHWLAVLLDGEKNIKEAWEARGDGYASTVTEQGWERFSQHLRQARASFTEAWKLRPESPLAAIGMIHVSLGDSNITEMRVWFDRAVAAQIDNEYAWFAMRYGLLPRWHGDERAMLAFGVMAANTRRFDTDVPRYLFDSVRDIESEEGITTGHHIYSRSDIWPHLQKMYEGYIDSPATTRSNEWRTSYATVAYFAGQYDTAREQLEAINWEMQPSYPLIWHVDNSLMPLEVAARTGPSRMLIAQVESMRANGQSTQCLQVYRNLQKGTNIDTRTLEFIHYRIASLEVEDRLEKGEWVDFLPKDDHDPNWIFATGKAHVLPNGAVEVVADPNGHLLYSRVRVGSQFEARGTIEVVRSSSGTFQAGLVMGLPEPGDNHWNAFRLKRNHYEGQVASFSHRWTKGMFQSISLNDSTNSFDFSIQNDQINATVNGTPVFSNLAGAKKLNISEQDHLLGLGAFNDESTVTVRYRSLQVRRLSPTTNLALKQK